MEAVVAWEGRGSSPWKKWEEEAEKKTKKNKRKEPNIVQLLSRRLKTYFFLKRREVPVPSKIQEENGRIPFFLMKGFSSNFFPPWIFRYFTWAIPIRQANRSLHSEIDQKNIFISAALHVLRKTLKNKFQEKKEQKKKEGKDEEEEKKSDNWVWETNRVTFFEKKKNEMSREKKNNHWRLFLSSLSLSLLFLL